MKLWEKGLPADKKIERFTVGNDREMDLALAEYDVIGSMAHAQMLGTTGIISNEEADALVAALQIILDDIRAGQFIIEENFEDVHSKVEYLLIQKLGDTGRKIHTARSRNDQVLTDIHLFLKVSVDEIRTQVKSFFDLLMALAEKHKETLMPGYTHMQIAMPSSFGMWFSAYAESLVDDMELLNAAYKIVDQNPLGSAAGYGSSFPIDRKQTTGIMGFATLKYNSAAAQMSRGKSEKTVAFAMAAVAATLSKFAMDVCLYMGQNFSFISLPENLTTGSSIMPHKNNPDVFELIRGKCNALQSVPVEITMLTTNLPSGYHRDFQLLKASLFPAINELKSCLDIALFATGEIKVNEGILDDQKYDYLFTVEAVNNLVKEGMPFRTAYQEIGTQLKNGTFVNPGSTSHTHEGSVNNLCLDAIRMKMEKAFKNGEV